MNCKRQAARSQPFYAPRGRRPTTVIVGAEQAQGREYLSLQHENSAQLGSACRVHAPGPLRAEFAGHHNGSVSPALVLPGRMSGHCPPKQKCHLWLPPPQPQPQPQPQLQPQPQPQPQPPQQPSPPPPPPPPPAVGSAVSNPAPAAARMVACQKSCRLAVRLTACHLPQRTRRMAATGCSSSTTISASCRYAL